MMETCQTIITRFAPSPTGRMHAGNIFSSLVSWLIAKRAGGKVVLRIEDLDAQRSKRDLADQVMRDYEALGLNWDGEPVYQSTRHEAYCLAFDQLCQRGLVYPCYCSRADLHVSSAPHAGERFVYAGTCRNMTAEKRAAKEAQLAKMERVAAMRLIAADETISFEDAFQGRCEQRLAIDCGDFVIRRSDGLFAYQLAVVLDDDCQGIDCVVRGADLLSSTPQQIYLSRLLGLRPVRYARVPLMVDRNGRRLSKRQADASLESMLRSFRTYEGIVGHIAFIAGLVPEDVPISCEDLVSQACLDALVGKREIVWE